MMPQKNLKLTKNNKYESSSDILKKIEINNNNECKQNFTSIEALSTIIELDLSAKKYKILRKKNLDKKQQYISFI